MVTAPRIANRAMATDPLTVIFVNIELRNTVQSIVAFMCPTVICFCKFGQVMHPLTKATVQRLQRTIEKAWKLVTAWHIEIQFLHGVEARYLTAWVTTQRDCRTARAFLWFRKWHSDAEGTNIMHLHVPSGTKPLSD